MFKFVSPCICAERVQTVATSVSLRVSDLQPVTCITSWHGDDLPLLKEGVAEPAALTVAVAEPRSFHVSICLWRLAAGALTAWQASLLTDGPGHTLRGHVAR
jgi:hypothetical protein